MISRSSFPRSARLALAILSRYFEFSGIAGGQIYTAMGRRATDADLAVSVGACLDYADPIGSFMPFVDWFPSS